MSGAGVHPEVRVGHVHLRVANLERATAFYRDVLGFDVVAYGPDFGLPGAAFLAAGGYHHHIGLNTWTSEGGDPPPRGHTGLYHVAFLYPDRSGLGDAVRRLLDHGYPIDGAEDHGATVSVYLRDPDGNGIELYYDRPRRDWFDSRGAPILKAEALDPRDLLAEAPGAREREEPNLYGITGHLMALRKKTRPAGSSKEATTCTQRRGRSSPPRAEERIFPFWT